MRLTELVIVTLACVFFLIGSPLNASKTAQRQEEQATEEEYLEEETGLPTYRIAYKVKNPQEETVADIIWLKQASVVALEHGNPHFNVLEQKIEKRFDKKSNSELSTVEGLIELTHDPMEAEYDAQEIDSLVLPEYTVE